MQPFLRRSKRLQTRKRKLAEMVEPTAPTPSCSNPEAHQSDTDDMIRSIELHFQGIDHILCAY